MIRLVLLAAVFMISGCVTFSGSSSYQDLPGKIENKACIEKAIKSVPRIRYEDMSDYDIQESTSFLGEPIHTRNFIYYYSVQDIQDSRVDSRVTLTEESSKDPKYNRRRYYNRIGVSQSLVTDHDKEISKTVLIAVDRAVQKECSLPNFNPLVR
jgi:hypothetical protein